MKKFVLSFSCLLFFKIIISIQGGLKSAFQVSSPVVPNCAVRG
jgi:hypothetical protein